MLNHGFFPFHVVSQSPWPLYLSCGSFLMILNTVFLIHHVSCFSLLCASSTVFFLLSFYGWMRDICCESFLEGNHTILVQKGLKMGMVLFISSEILFFFSFFWSLMYYSISPSVEIYSWPPQGVMTIDPMGIPLFGTMILISSGISVTWSHHSTLLSKKSKAVFSLFLTILLGVSFSLMQFSEYVECSFTFSDSSYGSMFYLSTGFHGIHVIMGTTMLVFCLIRMIKNQFSKSHHVGFELAIWYWHFVDVVWLFLYICVYWWGAV